jgi:hypothetical protein
MNMKWKLAAIVGLVGLATYSASAITVLSDNFDYPDGDLVGAPGSPWTAHSGAGSGPIQVTNSQILINRSNAEDVNAPLSGATYSTNSATSLYASFTVNFSELPTLSGTYLAHFRGTNSFAYPCRVIANTTNAAAGNYRLTIANGTTYNSYVGGAGQYPLDLSTGTVYTVVIRLVMSTGQATMWINPNVEGDASVNGPDSLTPDDVDQFAFRQSSGEGVMLVDTLKVGTSFVDVVGLNSAPTISAVPEQNIGANTSTGPLPVTVTDAETPAGSLTLKAKSSNATLVPNLPANLSVGGSGENRTVTVTPAAGQQGSTVITLTIDDGVLTNSTQFAVNVGYPSISAIGNQITPSNTVAGPFSFAVNDFETAPGSLTVTAASSDAVLVPVPNIVIANLGGSNRTVTITPAANSVGSSDITLTVSDGILTDTATFKLTVYPKVGVILSDDFNYSDGAITDVSFGIWASHSGTNTEPVSVTNNRVLLSSSLAEDVNAVLSDGAVFPPFEASGAYVLYSRFTVNFSGLPGTSGSYFAHFKDLSTGYRARVVAGTEAAAPGCFRLGVQSSGNPTVWFPRDLALGVTYVVATRYNTVTSDSALWVNPISEGDQSVAASSTFSPIGISQYAFRQSSGIGDLAVDNLVVGTSFSDVAVAVAPESLTYQRVGSNVVLSWTQPLMALESATSVQGPYAHVPDAASSYTNATTGNQMYFRLRY